MYKTNTVHLETQSERRTFGVDQLAGQAGHTLSGTRATAFQNLKLWNKHRNSRRENFILQVSDPAIEQLTISVRR